MGDSESIDVANEYAAVTLKKTISDDGPKLEIRSTMLDHVITLDEAELHALMKQDKDFFSQLLQSPYGPIDSEGAFKEEL
jgi:hypothetical protein